LIFVGLVVLWLLILVPTVSRRRQEVARPSKAALSGRVLQRQQVNRPARRRTEEVDEVSELDEVGSVTEDVPAQRIGAPGVEQDSADVAGARRDDTADPGEDDAAEADGDEAASTHGAGAPIDAAGEHGDPLWERPAPRYRPGRGGFDPAAAAVAAQARYAFRRRIVFALLVATVVTGVTAVLVAPVLWWLHGSVDVLLVGYLVYLRRQVRMEETIRERRAARMAGTRQPAAAEDPDLDEWARRCREALAGAAAASGDPETGDLDKDDLRADKQATGDDGAPERAVAEAPAPATEELEPALPRLQSAAPPSLPSGTALLGVSTPICPPSIGTPGMTTGARRASDRLLGS